MFRFLMGVAFGAAGYWAWQSFGRDLLGLGNDQDTSYGGFNSGSSYGSGSPGTTAYGGGTISSTTGGSGSATPTSSTTSSGSTESPTSGT
jgi:hypothetical protein